MATDSAGSSQLDGIGIVATGGFAHSDTFWLFLRASLLAESTEVAGAYLNVLFISVGPFQNAALLGDSVIRSIM